MIGCTLEELETRLTAVEKKVLHLQQFTEAPTHPRGTAWKWRMTADQQERIREASARSFAKMGITNEPAGHERLMQMWLDEGIRPEDNVLSREIIAMRDEERG